MQFGADTSNAILGAMIAQQNDTLAVQRAGRATLDTKTGKLKYDATTVNPITGKNTSDMDAAYAHVAMERLRKENQAKLLKGRESGLSMTGGRTASPKLGSTLLTDPSILNTAPTSQAGKTLLGT